MPRGRGAATHAWAEVYLPGAGWIEYDPTNVVIAGENLIRVAVTRDADQILSGDEYVRRVVLDPASAR